MIVIPIGYERRTNLRWPWVTLALIVACVVVHLLLAPEVAEHDEQAAPLFEEAIEYLIAHPHLEAHPRLLNPAGAAAKRELAQVREELDALTAEVGLPEEPAEIRLAQARLDRLTNAWLEALAHDPHSRWGLKPTSYGALQTFTYMFVHAGWLHLLGNLLILYLAGPVVEDVWGRPLFAVFYLTAGVLAGLAQALRYPDLDLPLVGASGAIAGVMGAFLVHHWRLRIQFFYWFWPLTGTFKVAAWIILPVWMGGQLLQADVAHQASPSGAGGVAYWAHVTGFAFGVGAAGLIAQLGIEERFLRPRIHAAAGMLENPAIEAAYTAQRAGRVGEARSLLEAELKKNPGNTDATLALWSLACGEGRAGSEAPRLLRLVREELRSGETELALAHWREVRSHAPEVAPEPALAILLTEALAELESDVEAAALLEPLAARSGALPLGLLLRAARAAQAFDPILAAGFAARALDRPDLPPAFRAEIEALSR